MKFLFFSVLLTVFICNPSFSQSDTTIKYFSKTGQQTTKDSAVTFVKFHKENNLWHGREYFAKKGTLKSEGNYAQMNFETPVGNFKNYKEDGTLDNTAQYADGKAVEKTYYYKGGNKKSWILYGDKTGNQQKGWDENGKEIKNFVVEREARFKGGMEGWKKYIEKNVNANVAADAGAPEGSYEVKAQFIVSKEGYVTNVKAIVVPVKCKPCGVETVRVISEAPQWENAIQNNEPVLYQAIQYLTFRVEEERKKKKG